MFNSMLTLINRERQAKVADCIGEEPNIWWHQLLMGHSVYNWMRGTIKSVASVIVTLVGLSLVGKGISGAQAGLILSFALVASQGKSNYMVGEKSLG